MNTPDTVNNKVEFVKKYEGFTIIETDIFAKEYFLFVKKGRVQMKVTVPKKVFENYRKRDIIKKDIILKWGFHVRLMNESMAYFEET